MGQARAASDPRAARWFSESSRQAEDTGGARRQKFDGGDHPGAAPSCNWVHGCARRPCDTRALAETQQRHDGLLNVVHGARWRGSEIGLDETGIKIDGFRRERGEGLTEVVLPSMDGRAVGGDDEKSRKCSTGQDSEELGVVDLRLPGAVPGVEEVAGVEVVASVCSAEPEELHGGVSTTAAPVCCRWIQKRKRGIGRGEGWRRRRRGRGTLGHGSGSSGSFL